MEEAHETPAPIIDASVLPDDFRRREYSRTGRHRPRDKRSGGPVRLSSRRPTSAAGRYTAERAAKRERFLDATAAVIADHGPAVSMEEIAAACGVTKPILYRHFGDRSGLVRALAERYAADIFTELDEALTSPQHPRTLLATTIDAYLRLLEKQPELYQFVTQRAVDYLANESPTMVGNFQREVGRRVAVVMGEKLREANMDSGGVEPIAQGIVGLVHSAGDWWIERRSMPRARLVAYLTDLIWGGLSGSAPAEGS